MSIRSVSITLVLSAAAVLLAAFALKGHSVPFTAPAVSLSSDKAEIPMALKDDCIVVQVTIDGKGPYPFVVDTGAESTVLSSSLAEELGLHKLMDANVAGPGGVAMPGQVVQIGKLQLGGATITGLTVVAFDMSRVFVHSDPPRGILSGKLFSGYLLTLDYVAGRMSIEKGALPAADGAEILDYDPASPVVSVKADVAGKSMALDIDTGSSHGIMMPEVYAQNLPLSAPTGAHEHLRNVNGETDVVVKKLKGSVKIGRYSFEDPDIAFGPDLKLANIGYGFLRSFALTIDSRNHRIRLHAAAP